MKIFVQPADVVTVTASAGGVTPADLIVAATSAVLDPIGTAMKAAGASTVGAALTASRSWRPAHRRCHGARTNHIQGDRPHPGAARRAEGRRRRGAGRDRPGRSDSASVEEWERANGAG